MDNLPKNFNDSQPVNDSQTVAGSFLSGEVLLLVTSDPNNDVDDHLIELLVRLSQMIKQNLERIELVSPEGSFTVECVNCYDKDTQQDMRR